jgi:hypothetical protein
MGFSPCGRFEAARLSQAAKQLDNFEGHGAFGVPQNYRNVVGFSAERRFFLQLGDGG